MNTASSRLFCILLTLFLTSNLSAVEDVCIASDNLYFDPFVKVQTRDIPDFIQEVFEKLTNDEAVQVSFLEMNRPELPKGFVVIFDKKCSSSELRKCCFLKFFEPFLAYHTPSPKKLLLICSASFYVKIDTQKTTQARDQKKLVFNQTNQILDLLDFANLLTINANRSSYCKNKVIKNPDFTNISNPVKKIYKTALAASSILFILIIVSLKN